MRRIARPFLLRNRFAIKKNVMPATTIVMSARHMKVARRDEVGSPMKLASQAGGVTGLWTFSP